MCGLVDYLGKREAAPIVLAGLEALEYRGFDSAGIAEVDTGIIENYQKIKQKVAWHTYASVVKARSLLGWKSENDLKEALKDSWRWEMNLGKTT